MMQSKTGATGGWMQAIVIDLKIFAYCLGGSFERKCEHYLCIHDIQVDRKYP
jgi:hypothetical protein